MSHKTIRAAIQARLSTWALAQSPPIPIAWQNNSFTPTSQARYLRAFLLPAETQDPAMDGSIKTYIGIYQVLIFVPDGTGPDAAETLAGDLIQLFPFGLMLSQSGLDILITKTPSQAPAIPEPGWYVVPLSISYRSDVT